MRAARDAGVALADVDLLAVAAGPGSFTGLRVGIATMQGLRWRAACRSCRSRRSRRSRVGRRRPVTGLIAAWMDAQRGEVFAALYGRDGADRCSTADVAAARRDARRVDAAHGVPGAVRFVGDGAVRYARDHRDRSSGARAALRRRAAAGRHRSAGSPRESRSAPCCRTRSCRSTSAGRTPSWRATGTRRVSVHDRTPRDVIERAAPATRDLDAVVALEAESFTNPWTREMLARRAARTPTSRASTCCALPGRPVAAFCACWVIVDELHINTHRGRADARRRRGSRRALLRHVLRRGGAAGARRGRRSRSGARTSRRSASTKARLRAWPASGRSYYTQPEEDALILWRELR